MKKDKISLIKRLFITKKYLLYSFMKAEIFINPKINKSVTGFKGAIWHLVLLIWIYQIDEIIIPNRLIMIILDDKFLKPSIVSGDLFDW